MKASEFGRKVRAQIEKGWCRGKLARDKDGNETEPKNPRACSWCLVGACIAAIPPDESEADLAARRAFVNRLRDETGQDRAWFNDAEGRTKEQVIEAIDRAIERCEHLELAA